MSQLYLIDHTTFASYEDISINVKPERILVFVKKMQDLDLKPFLNHPFYYDFVNYISYTGFDTAHITTPATSAADGTYTDQPIISAHGLGGVATFIVLAGLVTSVVEVNPGSRYAVGDTFTVTALPGAVFTIASLKPYYVFDVAAPQAYIDLLYGTTYTDLHGHRIDYEGLIPAMVYFTFSRFIEADAVRYTATGPVTKHHDNADPLKISDIAKLVQQQRSVANAHCNEVEKFLYDNKASFPLWKFSENNKNARQPGPRIRAVDRTSSNYPNGYNGSNYSNYWGINDLI